MRTTSIKIKLLLMTNLIKRRTVRIYQTPSTLSVATVSVSSATIQQIFGKIIMNSSFIITNLLTSNITEYIRSIETPPTYSVTLTFPETENKTVP